MLEGVALGFEFIITNTPVILTRESRAVISLPNPSGASGRNRRPAAAASPRR